MTWEIVLGIFTLISFIITIITMVSKFIRSITHLESAVDGLVEAVGFVRKDHEKNKDKVDTRLDGHDKCIADHETRITVIERTKNNEVVHRKEY